MHLLVLLVYSNIKKINKRHFSLLKNFEKIFFTSTSKNFLKLCKNMNSHSTASLSLAEQWTITEIRRLSHCVLTYHKFPAHRCPSAIKFKKRLECASVN